MKKIFLVAAMIYCSQAFTQDTTSTKPLEQVVITANKFSKKQSETGKVITVLDRSYLDRMGGRTLGEVLNTVAATNIIGANGSPGTNQRISIRGASDGNVLLLINGVPANDPSVISNYFDLNFINPLSIERIEILKAAQSTLYGSDAVAGVINIITKKNVVPSVFSQLGFSSYNTLNADAGFRGKSGIISYGISGSATRSAGFSSAYDSTGHKNFDNDGFQKSGVHGELGIALSKNFSIDLFSNYSRYKTELDAAAFVDDKDFYGINKNAQAGLSANWKQKTGNLHVAYNFNYTDRFYSDDSVDRTSFAYFSKSSYTGRTHYAEAYETLKLKSFEILGGVDYRFFNTSQFYKSVSSYGPYESYLNDSIAAMNQWSPYASVVYRHKNLSVETGGRLNVHSSFGNHFTYTLNPSFLINNKLKVFANLATAFKSPSLFQLFEPYIGNRDLAPEQSQVAEAGIEFFHGEYNSIRLTAFQRETDNAIQFIITDPNFFTGKYMNISRQKNHGFELEQRFAAQKWSVSSNYAFTKGSIRSHYSESGMPLAKDSTYNNLYRVPEHAANFVVGYKAGKKLMLTGIAKFVGKRLEPVYAAAPKELKGYHTLDLSTQYSFNPRLIAFADAKNITNQQYFDVLGYTTRKFNFSVGVRMQL